MVRALLVSHLLRCNRQQLSSADFVCLAAAHNLDGIFRNHRGPFRARSVTSSIGIHLSLRLRASLSGARVTPLLPSDMRVKRDEQSPQSQRRSTRRILLASEVGVPWFAVSMLKRKRRPSRRYLNGVTQFGFAHLFNIENRQSAVEVRAQVIFGRKPIGFR